MPHFILLLAIAVAIALVGWPPTSAHTSATADSVAELEAEVAMLTALLAAKSTASVNDKGEAVGGIPAKGTRGRRGRPVRIGSSSTSSSSSVEALATLYNATNGDEWLNNTGWLDDGVPVCAWYGLVCEDGGDAIVAVSLGNNNLVGMIPPGVLTGLPSLRSIVLNGPLNRLGGAFPFDDLGAVSNLTTLDLSYNDFAGSIPRAAFGALTSLVNLALEENLFVGAFPFEALPASLQTLYLHFNAFTSSIPVATFEARLANLVAIDANENTFTGPLPAFADLPYLEYIMLRANFFTGPIPVAAYATLTALTYLGVHRNPFVTGSIPPTIAQIPSLQYFAVSGNTMMTGSIPSELGLLSRLMDFQCQDVPYFTHRLPSELGQLSSLSRMSISQTSVTGPIPDTFRNVTNLQFLYLANNKMTGSLPVSLFYDGAPLRELQILNNRFTSTLPSELALARSISVLAMATNLFSGTIPPAVASSLTNLFTFSLQANRLSGTIPPFRAVGMQNFNVAFNFFTSSLPNTMKFMINLQQLTASNNYLTGTLPDGDFNMWLRLRSLDLAFNSYNNSLAQFFGDWIISETAQNGQQGTHVLAALNLNDNRFTGTYPTSLLSFGNIQTLNLQNNNLSGRIGNSRLPTFVYYVDLSNNALLSGPIPEAWSQNAVLAYLKIVGTRMQGSFPSSFLQYSANDFYQPFVQEPYICPRIVRYGSPLYVGLPFLLDIDPAYYNYSACLCSTSFFGRNAACLPCDSRFCRCEVLPVATPEGVLQLTSYLRGCYPLFEEDSNGTAIRDIIQCPAQSSLNDKEVCTFTSATTSLTCAEGYRGRLCSQCDANYYLSGRECVKCMNAASYALIPVNILVFFGFVLYYYYQSKVASNSATLKLLVFHIQMMSILVTAGTQWDIDVLKALAWLSLTSRVSSSASLQCVFQQWIGWDSLIESFNPDGSDDDYPQMRHLQNIDIIVSMAVPLLFIVAFCAIWGMRRWFGPENNWHLGLEYVTCSLAILFYFEAVNKIFEVLGCTLRDETSASSPTPWYLNTYPWYQCRPINAEYEYIVIVACVALIVCLFFAVILGIHVAKNIDIDKEPSSESFSLRSSLSTPLNYSYSPSINTSQNTYQRLDDSKVSCWQALRNKITGAVENFFDILQRRDHNDFVSTFECYSKGEDSHNKNRENRWPYEFWLLFRRIAIAVAVNVIPFTNFVVTSISVYVILLASIYLQHTFLPFHRPEDNMFEQISLYLLLLSYFVGIASFVIQISREMQWIIAGGHIILIAVMLFTVFYPFSKQKKNNKNDEKALDELKNKHDI